MRSVAAAAIFFALLSFLIGGCGLLPDQVDETAKWSAEKLYAEAKEAMNDGAYDKAIKNFEKRSLPLWPLCPAGADRSRLCLFQATEPASATAACDRSSACTRITPTSITPLPEGLVNFGEDLGILGVIGMQDLTERDPKAARESLRLQGTGHQVSSRYAADATARMNYLSALASHQVHVARYYLKRGAYVATVNRAQTSLKTYPGAPANEQALFVMIKAYDALGMRDLRDDTERVMRKNFPNSELFTHGLDRPEPWWRLW